MQRVLWILVLPFLLWSAGVAEAQAAGGEHVVDMEFDGARLADVLRVLGELGGYNVIVDPGVQQQVSFRLQGMTVDEALEMVIRTSGYSYRVIGNTLVVGTEAVLQQRFDKTESWIVQLRYANPETLLPFLRFVVPNVQVQVDATQRALVLRGTPGELAEAVQLVRERDVRPLVSQEFVDTPVVEILRSLARLGGYNMLVQGEIGGRMTVVLDRQTVESAIDFVTRRAGLAYEIEGTDLVVMTPSLDESDAAGATPALQVQERRIFELIHIPPSRIIDAVRVLAASGEVWSDEASRMIIVSAGPAAVRQIDELVARLDVPVLSARGIVRQGHEYVAILEVDQVSYIVRAGDEVGAVTVLAVDADGVLVETAHGRRVRVPAGGL